MPVPVMTATLTVKARLTQALDRSALRHVRVLLAHLFRMRLKWTQLGSKTSLYELDMRRTAISVLLLQIVRECAQPRGQLQCAI